MPTLDEAVDGVLGASSAPKLDPLAAAVAQTLRDDDVRVRQSLASTTDFSPDAAAQAARLGRARNLPPDVVLRNLPEVQRRQLIETGSTLLDGSPTLKRRVADRPDFTQQVSDEIDRMVELEAKVRQFGELKAYRGAEPQLLARDSMLRGIATTVPETLRAMREGLRLQMGDFFDMIGFLPRDEVAKREALRRAEQANARTTYNDPYFGEGLGADTASAIYGGLKSTAQQGLGIAASIATGSPAPGLAVLGLQQQTQAYSKYRARGASGGMASLGAAGEAAVEVGTELLPMGFLVDKLGKTGMREFMAGLLARELPTEQIATAVEDALDTAIANPDKSWGDYLAERPGAAYQTLVSTVTQSLVMGGANKVLERSLRAVNSVNEAGRDAEVLQALSALAAQAKLRERNPEEFRTMLQDMVDDADGAPTEVRFDARTLVGENGTGGLLNQEELAQLPGIAAQLQEALTTGGEVVVPVADLLTVAPGTPLEQKLLEHARIGQNELSQFEAKEAAAQAETYLQAEAQRVMAQATDAVALQTSADTVKQTVLDQLNTAKRFTPDVNEAYATLVRDFYVAMSARAGMTPEELHAKYPLRVLGENPAAPGQVLNAGEQTATPEFKNWFGDSKVVDDNGKPLVVYHGTTGDFSTFDRIDGGNAYGPGYYFTTDPAEASGYADGTGGGRIRPAGKAAPNVMPVYLSAKNVLTLDRTLTKAEIGKLEAASNSLNPGSWKKGELAKAFDRGYPPTARNVMQYIAEQVGGSNTELAQAASYDGLKGGYGYVVFRPEQIKSAIGNRGAFDPNDPSILNQKTQRPGALTVEGYNFGKTNRTVLSGSNFGKGLVGNMRDVFLSAEDTRLRKRIYFYVDKGTGINPEAGVGGIARRATLSNIYDANSDPLRLRKGDQLAFESAVLDAGYSGYLDRLEGSQSGHVIMLGDQRIPVEVLGPTNATKGAVVPAPAQRETRGRDVVVDALNANKGLPSGAPTRARWSEILAAQMPAEHAALQAAGVFDGEPGENLYKSDLVRAFEENTPAEAYAQSRVKSPTPAIGKLLRNLTPAEQQKITDKTAAKVIAQLKNLPSAREMAAVAYAGRAKRGWYRRSAETISAVFGPDGPRFAGLLAAMSPQCSVETNLLNTLNTWKNWVAAGRPQTRDEIVAIMGRSVQGNNLTDSVLPAWINNGVRALTSEDPGAVVMSGPKVNSFYRNLIGDVNEVTNDAWMANFALVDQNIFAGRLNASGTDPGKGTGYLAMSARAREAAATLTKLTGETWTPAEVQETVWSWAKALYETANNAAEQRTARELIEEGALTDDLINSTPDFGSLFYNPTYAKILEDAGYGDQLSALSAPVADDAGQPDEESDAAGQAGPFAPEDQRRLELQAARRLEQLAEERGNARAAAADRSVEDQLAEANAEAYEQADTTATLADFTPANVGRLLSRTDWAILTAENPAGRQSSAEDNAAALARLKADLDALGVRYLDAVGKYGNVENSVAIAGITEEQATLLGLKYGQESVLTPRGLVYMADGHVVPVTGQVDTFEQEPEDFYTTIPGTGARFAIGLDFEAGAEAISVIEENASGESSASLEAQSRVAQEREQGRTRVLVDRNGSVRPLIGVDAVDQRARAGQVILQRGVGAAEWTVLEQGEGVTKGSVARAIAKASSYAQGPRGTFNPNSLTISLLEKADLSTFLHETGHFFLEVMADVASQPDAPAAVAGDMQTLLQWFGINDLAKWNTLTLDQKRKHHERFAESFEQYLLEGKAPSVELQPLFQRFRSWLTSVYRSLAEFMRGRDLQLSDEVRAVFDRMLATDQQIQIAEDARGFSLLFKSAEQAGMTPEAWAAYQAQGAEATALAIDKLQSRSVKDMRWASNARSRALKALQKEAEGKRKGIEAEVAAEVAQQPLYRAIRWLRKGEMVTEDGEEVKAEKGFRLNTEALAEMYPATALDNPELDRLKGMTAANGLHPDMVAPLFGFDSGDALVRAVADAEPMSSVVEGMTDQRMLERFGDLATPQGLQRAADEAVHNEARGRFIATGLKALQDAGGKTERTPAGDSVNVMVRAAKQFADQLVARRKIRELKLGVHTMAEARAGRAAQAAMKTNDTKAAIVAQRDQLLQHYAARATMTAQNEVERGLAYLKKFDKESIRKKLPMEYVDQIDKLLERVDLRKQTNAAIDKRAKLAAWIKSQQDLGIEVELPDYLLEDAQLTSYRDLPVEAFRGLVETVKQIEHLGRLKSKLLTAKDQREFEAIRDEIVASVLANAGGRVADTRTPTSVLGKKLQAVKAFGAAHVKAATWARIFDGGKDGGPVWEFIIRPANAAADAETTMRAEATKALTEILTPWLKQGGVNRKTPAPSVGRSLSRQERLVVALNIGNEGNLQRLLGGEGWTPAQLKPVLDSLTPDDWKVVQAVWDFFEQRRPLVDQLEQRIFGKPLKKVEPGSEFTEAYKVRGGYYPIVYDPAASQRAEEHADAEQARQQLAGAYSAATVRRGFTKARAEEVLGRPLMYDLSGLYRGTNDQIHYLAWAEWLIDTNRLLRDKALDTAIRTTYGPEAVRQFKTWRDAAAEGDSRAQEAMDTTLGWLRRSVSMAGLGFNVMSAMMQPLGFAQSITRVGAGWVGKGVLQYIGAPIAKTREVSGKSEFMANRTRTRFRELNELRNRVEQQTAIKRLLNEHAFAMMMRVQQMVDTPTWLGAYEKAIATGETEDRAVALADQAVIDSQGGGQTKDLAAIERGGPAQKLFTVFYTFMNTAANLGIASKMTPKSKAKFAADMLMLYTVPAVLGVFLRDALTPGDSGDEDEKLWKKLVAAQLGYLFGLFVVGREVGEAAKIVTGMADHPRDYQGPAGLRALADTYALAKQAGQGEFDDAFRKAVINLSGDLLGLPSAQLNRTITGAQALKEGKTKNPAALLFGYQEPR